jgi:exonuclease SbcD
MPAPSGIMALKPPRRSAFPLIGVQGTAMRLIHTSDWHLGRSLHGESLLGYQAQFLDWLLDQAVRHQVDAVLVAGDVYDRAVPPTDAVKLLDRALLAFAHAGIPVVLTSGNHDSAIRLGFGAGLSEVAGVHLRTGLADLARPVLLGDAHGDVAVYGIPYLLPDAVMAELDCARSHEAVLTAATARIRADATARGIGRIVVLAHAFVTGGQPAESERDIRVGGIADVPAAVFGGFSYVALGHLHGQQEIAAGDGGPVVRYSGSPLAFSFGEKNHAKSVTLAEIHAAGQVTVAKLATPVPRPLREVRGRLAGLLARADGDLADLAGAWVKVALTDPVRPAAPMERLREKWPHTLALDFAPEGGLASADADLARLAAASDPVEICGLFVEFTSGGPPDEAQRAVLRAAVEAAQQAEAAA